jgi:hypothetical protein
MINITIQKAKYKYVLGLVKDKGKASNIKAFLNNTCEPLLVKNVEKTFREKTFFDGSSTQVWTKLSDTTKKRRLKKGTWYGDHASKLQEYYDMYNNIKSGVFRRNSAGSHSIGLRPSGKEAEKANIHQYGQTTPFVIPARPPLTFQEDIIDKIIHETERYLSL